MSGNLVDGVLFDYGGVLTGSLRESVDAWHAADRIDPATFTRALRNWLSRTVHWATPIHRLETGELAPAEFEQIFAAELRLVDGGPVDPQGLLVRMFQHLRPDPAMFELVEALKQCGVRVGLLSNSWGGTSYPRPRIDVLFDSVVISSEVGMRKPQAAIYHHALDALGVPARRTLFVDDAEQNVIGAQAIGLRALQHLSPRCTRAALAALVPDLTDSLQGARA